MCLPASAFCTIAWARVRPGLDRVAQPAARARAESFEHDVDGQRHLTASVLVHELVADVAGERLEVEQRLGRAPTAIGRALQLSLTHAGAWVGAACSDRPVGLDVEPVLAFGDPEPVASVALSPTEFRAWRLISDRSAACRCLAGLWTAKESVVKARGTGWVVEPSDIEIACVPTREARLQGDLTLLDVSPDVDHVATLATRHRSPHVVVVDGDRLVARRVTAIPRSSP